MNYHVKFSSRARYQTLLFLKWVLEELGAKKEAESIEAVREMEAELARQPYRYRRFAKHPKLGDLRVATIYYHRFIYLVDDESEVVEVIFVRHEKADVVQLRKELGRL